MAGRIRSVSSHQRLILADDWAVCSTAAGQASDSSQMSDLPASAWVGGLKLGTAAAMLRQSGAWSLDGEARRFDSEDWWFRREFSSSDWSGEGALILGLDGLATIAEVWLNGELVLRSSNMFIGHEVDIRSRLQPTNELLICCRSLDRVLAQRRARPRWRAPMVEHQQLRWIRTTLLGRTPGWSPPAAAVGPWGAVWIERRDAIRVKSVQLRSSVSGRHGQVDVSCELDDLGAPFDSVDLVLNHRGRDHSVALAKGEEGSSYRGSLLIDEVALWWPHTHGEPVLYDARLEVKRIDQAKIDVDLGPIGFRTIVLDTEGGRFSFIVNGVSVFCRGACWTPPDIVALRGTHEAYEQAVRAVREAGMNMLRVGGTMVYEDFAFLECCDRYGVLVWQDLMFANMDYPLGDEAFASSVEVEAAQQLRRLQAHPCVALICGNSEVEQQAAMWGTARQSWEPKLFHEDLRRWTQLHCPGVAYWPSSAHGGSIPHQIDVGSTSYFGVGAYLRPLDDARRSNLQFASESLAFANVPEESTMARMPGGLGVRVHHPTWKMRSPRDLGAGWDFDDVRDFYFAKLFGVEPLTLRYSNHDRYLKLSRILTGEIMNATLSEWRRSASSCNGALIWFLRDLWAGAGWGLLDDRGAPKACYHYVKRACQPIAVSISDEGCNGLHVHVWNDPGAALSASLDIALYRLDGVCLGRSVESLALGPHSSQTIVAGSTFDTALDLSAAFRFSESEYATVVANLRGAGDELLAQAFHSPAGFGTFQHADVGLTAKAYPESGGRYELTLTSRLCAQAVHFDISGYRAVDEYFHMAPQSERRVVLEPITSSAASDKSGQVSAMNSRQAVNIEWLS